ncbi:MAG: tail fiber domain-containing protein, partial [Wenzhouxiangella sp.]|nr:tail fiber domain-containing protein [Wenzhouxiangella sp.]
DPLCLNNGNRIALCSSSARYKEAIETLDLGLDTVLALTPVAYRWTTDDREDIGFVAEDIAEIDERLIMRNAAGEIEGVRYGRLTAVLANAVQTMNQTQRDQAAELVQLKSENDSLREQLAELQGKQEDKLIHLEQELALLRAMIAPRIARETP